MDKLTQTIQSKLLSSLSAHYKNEGKSENSEQLINSTLERISRTAIDIWVAMSALHSHNDLTKEISEEGSIRSLSDRLQQNLPIQFLSKRILIFLQEEEFHSQPKTLLDRAITSAN